MGFFVESEGRKVVEEEANSEILNIGEFGWGFSVEVGRGEILEETMGVKRGKGKVR